MATVAPWPFSASYTQLQLIIESVVHLYAYCRTLDCNCLNRVGPRRFFKFPENTSPRKKIICKHFKKKVNFEQRKIPTNWKNVTCTVDMNSEICKCIYINSAILYKCIDYRMLYGKSIFSKCQTPDFQNFLCRQIFFVLMGKIQVRLARVYRGFLAFCLLCVFTGFILLWC